MGQRVRTAAPPGDWRSLTAICANANGHSQYDLVWIHNTVGMVYFETGVVLGGTFYPIYHCDKIVVNKWAGTNYAFAAGDKVYWSGIDGDGVTPVYRSTYWWIGVATEPASALATTVEIDLKGDKVTMTEPC